MANPHLPIHYRNAVTTMAAIPWWAIHQLSMAA